MTDDTDVRTPARAVRPQRRAWAAPKIQDLPRLTEFTLVTGSGIPGDGDIGGGGSTVIP